MSVTVCPPGQTTGCQTIDGVTVDTGSSGLRILSSALTASLPRQTTTAGAASSSAFRFRTATRGDLSRPPTSKIGPEQANSVPVQIVGAPGAPAAPDGCTSSGTASENTLDTLGANGILGIGIFRQDCGPACAFAGSSNPGLVLRVRVVGLSGHHRVADAAAAESRCGCSRKDNNGVLMQLPNVSPPGQVAASGLLFFGIGTQSNNALGNANVFTLDASGNMTTTYRANEFARLHRLGIERLLLPGQRDHADSHVHRHQGFLLSDLHA